MPIDPSKVVWDDAPATSSAIDMSQVQWDDPAPANPEQGFNYAPLRSGR